MAEYRISNQAKEDSIRLHQILLLYCLRTQSIRFILLMHFRKHKLISLLTISPLACAIIACTDTNSTPSNIQQGSVVVTLSEPQPIRLVKDLSQDTIRSYAKLNSCYLPLLRDISLFDSEHYVPFHYDSLFNAHLPNATKYSNRYLVGDFNSLNEFGESRGIQEVNPKIQYLIDFQEMDSTFFMLLDSAANNSVHDSKLDLYLDYTLQRKKDLLNFYNKIWSFKTPPLKRKYSVIKNNVYAAGQKICLCEAHADTLINIAEFAVSSKRLTPVSRVDSEGRKPVSYGEYLPINRRRDYYAAKNIITSKNWERARKYEEQDAIHDSLVGGGYDRVTFYKRSTELPNFLLIEPEAQFDGSMRNNGIHEAALSGLSRGMLGTPNSIGCIRVSDFGSKFLRWWTPQNANFFILYTADSYFKKLDHIAADSILPFKDVTEGNMFRLWLHQSKPKEARIHNIDSVGEFSNGYIIDAYTIYGEEYEEHVRLIKESVHD
tara:strand:- start:44 stop:1513 length:1470 start_codon:yes stop_codon:yes gene_type:complete